jgi:hypothetical protein
VVAHACNPSYLGGRVRRLEVNLDCIVRLYLKRPKINKQTRIQKKKEKQDKRRLVEPKCIQKSHTTVTTRWRSGEAWLGENPALSQFTFPKFGVWGVGSP